MPMIVVAGATGGLGARIVRALVARGAVVRALVRHGSSHDKLTAVRAAGAEAVPVDFEDVGALTEAVRGADCLVSALSGLADVIVGLQTRLLEASVAAGVPRFIPSDFSIDFTCLAPGSNRNFDLRRDFRTRIGQAPIRATSIFNGAFADMLNGQMPLIVRPIRRVLYWTSPDRPFALTTMDDTAAFTAAAAMDPDAPRDLNIAGTQASVRHLAGVMTELTGHRYRPLRAGSLTGLARLIRVVRRLFPQREAVFPAWQGMQYLHNMFEGTAPSAPIDNGRYPNLQWTDLRSVLSAAPKT